MPDIFDISRAGNSGRGEIVQFSRTRTTLSGGESDQHNILRSPPVVCGESRPGVKRKKDDLSPAVFFVSGQSSDGEEAGCRVFRGVSLVRRHAHKSI